MLQPHQLQRESTFGELLEAKKKLLSLMDRMLEERFTEHVMKLLPHLPNNLVKLEEKHKCFLAHFNDPTARRNLHRLVCSVSTHGNLDSHSLMEACISIQAAKAQNILNVKRLQNKTATVGDGRIIPKLEASRMYKNEQVVWARFVLCPNVDVDQLVNDLNADKCIPIAKGVVEVQWPFRKRITSHLEALLEHEGIERIIFFSDLHLVADVCRDPYVVWSNLLSFFFCYTNDSVDIHVESMHDWERLISMSVLTRLFLDKPNLRLFGGNDTPIACMSGYNPYRSLRKLSKSVKLEVPNVPVTEESHTPINQGVLHPVYELCSNRDLQSVTGRSSIGGLNGNELILHHVQKRNRPS